ncbi:transmembrane protein 222-like [Paramacrobiotus metropolitanus]|uniref:transmembrane protein 222-like n=1 Tax=Paramacrobiotus metropolitanus TaxID=2943436 RepID=UPI002445C047|nr:transmembrane protein 222-like [Paramacrobiotus metropolitanus]XP_055334984.1 transmembrane protein 222-like [Paramacrobiotus metropolitanus]
MEFHSEKIDFGKSRYPFCIVWTPIPVLTWLFPFIGHMGIATSTGVIRDFAGPYFVSEDDMAFGRPTRYWRLDPFKAVNGVSGWDHAIAEASTEYNGRIHNLCCDNCHSHVAHALNLMIYNGSASWNMVKLCFLMLIRGRFVRYCDRNCRISFHFSKTICM